jgi:hypothetical protein
MRTCSSADPLMSGQKNGSFGSRFYRLCIHCIHSDVAYLNIPCILPGLLG